MSAIFPRSATPRAPAIVDQPRRAGLAPSPRPWPALRKGRSTADPTTVSAEIAPQQDRRDRAALNIQRPCRSLECEQQGRRREVPQHGADLRPSPRARLSMHPVSTEKDGGSISIILAQSPHRLAAHRPRRPLSPPRWLHTTPLSELAGTDRTRRDRDRLGAGEAAAPPIDSAADSGMVPGRRGDHQCRRRWRRGIRLWRPKAGCGEEAALEPRRGTRSPPLAPGRTAPTALLSRPAHPRAALPPPGADAESASRVGGGDAGQDAPLPLRAPRPRGARRAQPSLPAAGRRAGGGDPRSVALGAGKRAVGARGDLLGVRGA